MKSRKVSTMIFINENWEILLQKRWYYSKRWEDVAFFWWWIEQWETHQQSLIREMKEELNLDLKLDQSIYLWEFISEDPEDESTIVRYLYIQKTQKKAEEFTVLEWEWAIFVTIEKARSLKFPSNVNHILEYLENYLKSQ